MKNFIIKSNKYLNQEIDGYYNQDYVGYHKGKNPDFINRLKNMSNKYDEMDLVEDFIRVCEIASKDIFKIINDNNILDASICVMPRSKAEKNYKQAQLMFKKAISCVAKRSQLHDCSDAILRIKDTKTTHDWRLKNNIGEAPYVGITRNTCSINPAIVKGRDIILVDDIYTEGVNVCEDCIQTLLDVGAKSVILYVIAKTRE